MGWTRAELEEVRQRHQMQLTAPEMEMILAALGPGSTFLVFGLGRDSGFWAEANRGGRTAFLEDDRGWYEQREPGLEAHLVDYRTRLPEWRALLAAPAALAMELAPEIAGTAWDVILVDGPAGFEAASPGRMKSLHAATRLVKPGGHVFVHDAERRVERAYLRRFYDRFSLVGEIFGRALLRHYVADDRGQDQRTAAMRLGTVLGIFRQHRDQVVSRGLDLAAPLSRRLGLRWRSHKRTGC